MKRILSLLVALILISVCGFNTLAISKPTQNVIYNSVENFEDGSYIETVIYTESSLISTFATNTKTGYKTTTFYNSDDEIQWSATLTGTFTYTGSSSTCTASQITYSISNSKWKFKTATASKSGNKATGDIVVKRYTLGVPVQTVERTITLTCSATGVLS